MPDERIDPLDETALALRQAQRRGLHTLTLRLLPEGGWKAYTEIRENGVDRGVNREAADPLAAIMAALYPGRAVPPARIGDRLERLEEAMGELLGAIWTALEGEPG